MAVDVQELIGRIETDGGLLIEAAQRAGWDAPVPATEWTVRELVIHTGGIHRWAADIVTNCRDTHETEAGAAVGTGPEDSDLVQWFEDGHTALLRALRTAPAELECFTFLPADSPRHFWARRQAHETAMHRVDAQGAAGEEPTAFEPAFAQDGIVEMLNGFARRRSNAIATPGVIGLDVRDGASWLITLGGEQIAAEPSENLGEADLTVRGSSSDVYRWLWNRPSPVEVEGDRTLGQRWAESVRVRWS